MPKKRRHRRPVSLPELDALTPLTVKTVQNKIEILEMAQSQAAFGGNLRARVVQEQFEGHPRLVVVILYTASRVRIGPLDDAVAERLKRKVRWLAFFNRVATCYAVINIEPHSGDYLNVALTTRKSQPDGAMSRTFQ